MPGHGAFKAEDMPQVSPHLGWMCFFLMCSEWKLLPPSHPGMTHAANASPTASRAPRPPSSSW